MDFLLTTFLPLLVHVIIECPHRQCQCGRSLVLERIINGQSVMNPGTYPWQALLIVNGRFTVCNIQGRRNREARQAPYLIWHPKMSIYKLLPFKLL